VVNLKLRLSRCVPAIQVDHSDGHHRMLASSSASGGTLVANRVPTTTAIRIRIVTCNTDGTLMIRGL
jgi:hypothetical protein